MNLRGARSLEVEGRDAARSAEASITTPPHRASTGRDGSVRLIVAALSSLTFLVHVIAAGRMRAPIIQADEAGYLGNARYIAQGIGRTHAGYASGYSLLIAPAALLSRDPLTAYHLSLVVNALLAASLPLLGFFLARRVFPDASKTAIVGTALLLILYPGWSTLANLTLAENALVPAVLATACVISVARQSRLRWCLAAALASYASWVSPRGILVVVAFAFACLVSTRPWKSSSPGVPALVLALVLTAAGRAVNITIAGTTQVPGLNNGWRSQILRPLLHPHLWNDAVANLIGWLVYTSIATFGVVIIGSLILAAALAGHKVAASSSAIVPVATFALPALLLTWVLGALSAVQVPLSRLDHLVYGRYVDGVLAPVFVVGAVWLLEKTRTVTRRAEIVRALAIGAALVAAVGVFALIRPSTARGASLNIVNALALQVYTLHLHRSLPVVLLAAVCVVTAVLIINAIDRRAMAATIVLFLAWSSWVTYNGYAVHDSVGRAQQHVLVEGVDRLRAIGVDTSCVIVDRALSLSEWHLANYEFFVPATTFRIDAAVGPPKCGPLVLSPSAEVSARLPGAMPVSYENHIPIGLWVIPSRVPQPTRNRLLESGLVGPVPVTAALPDAAYRSSMQLVGREMTSRRLHFLVRLGHVGTGAPWPGSFSTVQPNGVGRVRLLVRLVDRSDNEVLAAHCPVTRTMLPGDTIEVDCVVRVAGSVSAEIEHAPGPYTVKVSMVQEGVTEFPKKGDRVAELHVTLGRVLGL
ncbi:MAG: hypothetical protein QOG50_1811 [Actinomycetota bacterium]|nr:hypothetical protein [Actinomycetota bacterium]